MEFCKKLSVLQQNYRTGVRFYREKIICAREEYEYAHKNRIRYGKLLNGLTFEYIDFKADAQTIFGESSDIFGDGSVITYLTPTHSAGSLIYKITENGKYYLCDEEKI